MNEKQIADIIHNYLAEVLQPMYARIKTLEHDMAAAQAKGIEYLGIYQRAQTYKRGDAVTYAGGLWIALKDTTDKPGTETSGWQLAVKSGRN